WQFVAKKPKIEILGPSDVWFAQLEVLRHVAPFLVRSGKNGKELDGEQKPGDAHGHEPERHQKLNSGWKINRLGAGNISQGCGAEAIDHAAGGTEGVAQVHGSQLVVPEGTEEQPTTVGNQERLKPEHARETIGLEGGKERPADKDVEEADRSPDEDQARGDAGGFVQNLHVHGAFPFQATQHGGSGDAA